MSYRFMRIIVFFDLPTQTAAERRDYRSFRRGLIKNGFMMWQESVYCRMVLNASVAHSVIDSVKRIRPKNGLVSVLTITEKQFAKTEYITGTYESEVIDSDERLIIL